MFSEDTPLLSQPHPLRTAAVPLLASLPQLQLLPRGPGAAFSPLGAGEASQLQIVQERGCSSDGLCSGFQKPEGLHPPAPLRQPEPRLASCKAWSSTGPADSKHDKEKNKTHMLKSWSDPRASLMPGKAGILQKSQQVQVGREAVPLVPTGSWQNSPPSPASSPRACSSARPSKQCRQRAELLPRANKGTAGVERVEEAPRNTYRLSRGDCGQKQRFADASHHLHGLQGKCPRVALTHISLPSRNSGLRIPSVSAAICISHWESRRQHEGDF